MCNIYSNGSTIYFLSYYPLIVKKSETTLISDVLISVITVFATYRFISSSIWGSELSDEHLRHERETFAKRCSVTYKYESSDCLYLIPEFTGTFVYVISIKIFVIDHIILKRAKYMVSFALASGIVVLAVSATMDFSRVMFHPTLVTYQLDDARDKVYQPTLKYSGLFQHFGMFWHLYCTVTFIEIHINKQKCLRAQSSIINLEYILWPFLIKHEIYYHFIYNMHLNRGISRFSF